MAELLEDVTNHFGQMESALGDFEKGELSEEDMDGAWLIGGIPYLDLVLHSTGR